MQTVITRLKLHLRLSRGHLVVRWPVPVIGVRVSWRYMHHQSRPSDAARSQMDTETDDPKSRPDLSVRRDEHSGDERRSGESRSSSRTRIPRRRDAVVRRSEPPKTEHRQLAPRLDEPQRPAPAVNGTGGAPFAASSGPSGPTTQSGSRPQYTRWGMMDLTPAIAASIASMNYEVPSEIQRIAIPPLLAGRDVVGQAVTGSGKTAAFGIPMCEAVNPKSRRVEGLVLVPTRELAQQVAKEISAIGSTLGIRVAAVYGGDPINRQIDQLERGAPIVVGTPGRIKDHMSRRTLDLGSVRFAVLDEADEMLDIGFADDMEHILRRTPDSRQTALFSATIPGFILKLIRRYLDDPVWVKLVENFGIQTVAEVNQYYYEVAERDKTRAVRGVLDEMPEDAQALIFRRMQVGVDRLARDLNRAGLPVKGIHGGMSQRDRDRVMNAFRDGSLRVLIATNVAARGLDISTITHVINHDMPDNVEEYVHRVGRTARMGKHGTAISFVGEHDYEILEKVMAKVGTDVVARRVLSIYGG
jgi:ATP-dependent RNA helicase DeaD